VPVEFSRTWWTLLCAWIPLAPSKQRHGRHASQALGCFTHWFWCAVISWTFPIIADWSGAHAFAFYAGMMVLQLLWVLTAMPETKGVPLEEIQRKLGIE
jgi:SP family xylose:H+ symportor-like MFS transporter